MSYPIYADAQGRRVAYISKPKPCYTEEIRANKQRRIMLENPTLYRAYWWHVVARTLLEVTLTCLFECRCDHRRRKDFSKGAIVEFSGVAKRILPFGQKWCNFFV